jgi:hypothetical protein
VPDVNRAFSACAFLHFTNTGALPQAGDETAPLVRTFIERMVCAKATLSRGFGSARVNHAANTLLVFWFLLRTTHASFVQSVVASLPQKVKIIIDFICKDGDNARTSE